MLSENSIFFDISSDISIESSGYVSFFPGNFVKNQRHCLHVCDTGAIFLPENNCPCNTGRSLAPATGHASGSLPV